MDDKKIVESIEKVDVRDEIISYLEGIRRPLSYIAKPYTDIPYGSIYSIFSQKVMELKPEHLEKINAWLKEDNKLLTEDFKL
jgi:hypothetical protein